MRKKLYNIITNTGFTLAEMVVVLGIVALIGTVTITRYRDFENSALLTTLAQDIALSVREAQLFGISVRGVGGNFDAGYGIFFSLNAPTSYILFADTFPANGDSVYGDSDIEVNVYTLSNGYAITDIRQVGGPSNEEYEELHLVFRRPDPDSEVMLKREGGVGYLNRTGSTIEVDITSPGGDVRTVRVSSTGQISITTP